MITPKSPRLQRRLLELLQDELQSFQENIKPFIEKAKQNQNDFSAAGNDVGGILNSVYSTELTNAIWHAEALKEALSSVYNICAHIEHHRLLSYNGDLATPSPISIPLPASLPADNPKPQDS